MTVLVWTLKRYTSLYRCDLHPISFLLSSDNALWNHLQVWVLEELELPVVSISSEGNRKKVQMKSPWEIIKRPAGSGGIFSLLSSNKILENLNEMGVQYTQVRS